MTPLPNLYNVDYVQYSGCPPHRMYNASLAHLQNLSFFYKTNSFMMFDWYLLSFNLYTMHCLLLYTKAEL